MFNHCLAIFGELGGVNTLRNQSSGILCGPGRVNTVFNLLGQLYGPIGSEG
jgi:hypothetical protein